MKNTIIKISVVGMAVALMAGCAATDYTEPDNVTKTGTGASSFEFDFSKINASTALTNAAATSSAPPGSTGVKFQADSSSAQTGIRPAIFAIGTTYPYAQAQAGFLKNPNYNGTAAGLSSPKTVSATLKWTSGSTDLGTNQKVGLSLAFQSDFNRDGNNDTVAYTVQLTHLNGAGSVLFIRTASITSGVDTTDGTCVTANSVGNLTAASTAHTAVITFTPASTAGLPTTISVTVDGGTAATFTESLGANMSTCTGGGADAANTTSFTVGGSAATLGGLFFGGQIPVWSVQVLAQNGDNATGIADTSSPVINSLSFQ